MIAKEWKYLIKNLMSFTPTEGQQEAINRFSDFMEHFAEKGKKGIEEKSVFILRGSAGTGKTSLARAFVLAAKELRQKVVLLAPTGRAAKVFSSGMSTPASTVHRKIYRQESYLSSSFDINKNLYSDTLFIIDEASMISTYSLGGEGFGSGSILDDIIKYVFSGKHCGMMLVGDTAQLPPIGCDDAPALDSAYLSGYGLDITDYNLLEVLRQSQDSGILSNAVSLREHLFSDELSQLPVIRFYGFADISICHGNSLIESLSSSYGRVGMDETIVLTRSNKRANIYNNGIRSQVLDYDSELSSRDQLMIVKNNYFWTEGEKDGPAFIANGDRCEVRRLRNIRNLYGFRFATALLFFPDYEYELSATVILDTLQSEAPSLTSEEQNRLFNNILEDYSDLSTKAERFRSLKKDEYFNALQIKYAYAVTCHKAQGGQWKHVYVDQGYVTEEMLTPSYIRWLYTAFTRASSHLFLVNWPKEQSDVYEEW